MNKPSDVMRLATESILAQIDMGLLDVSDADALVDNVAAEVTRFVPETRPLDTFSMLVGGTVSCVLYEAVYIKDKTGEYSPLISRPPEGED